MTNKVNQSCEMELIALARQLHFSSSVRKMLVINPEPKFSKTSYRLTSASHFTETVNMDVFSRDEKTIIYLYTTDGRVFYRNDKAGFEVSPSLQKAIQHFVSTMHGFIYS